MTIRVLLFAQYKELAGTGEISLDVPVPGTVGAAIDALRSQPGFDRLPAAPAVAVNRTVVRFDAPIATGDELALLPPVAGG